MNQQEQQDFLLSTFREEVDGHIVSLTRTLVELEESEEQTQTQSQIGELMRVLHTIKGASRMLGFNDISKVAHAMEEVVGFHRDNGTVAPRETVDLMFEGIDTIAELTRNATRRQNEFMPPAESFSHPDQIAALVKRLGEMVESESPTTSSPNPPTQNLQTLTTSFDQLAGVESLNLQQGGGSGSNDATTRANAALDKADETIRVRLDKLDSLINAAGELVINRIQNDEHLDMLQRLVAMQRQRSRLSTQLRDLLIEHMPVQERSELLGMTELFSFGDDFLNSTSSHNGEASDKPVEHETQEVKTYSDASRSNGNSIISLPNKSGLLDSRIVSRIYKKLEEIIVLDRKIEQASLSLVRERKAYNIRYEAMSDELRSNMLGIRMLPLDTIFGRFQRPIRDLANERAKEVRLVFGGGAIEIDKRILEQISDPLVHMLRNAVDHGIEAPEQRLIFGKPREGTVRLSAFQKGSHVVIEVADDGRGIDPLLLRKVAVEKKLLTSIQAESLGDEAALDLIFRPGFSTRSHSDEISGRGYGMDIVQQNIKRLNGRVFITSTPGEGTTFSLEIPLTLATMGALLVRSAGQLFALPSIMVSGLQTIQLSEIKTLEGKKAVRMRGQVLPIVDLSEVLGLQPLPNTKDNSHFRPADDTILTVLLSVSGNSRESEHNSSEGANGTERYIAFIVDELLDEREIVVKSLGSFLTNIPNIAGATVLGADGLALILDVFGLLQSVRLGQQPAINLPTPSSYKDKYDYWAVRPASRILVVDDSLATRELERSILEAAGYQVETARDGVEALQTCREHPFDLVLTDVEMPNMDGFRLSSAIYNDPRLHGLPVVIVSSRDSEQDRKRGLEVGAQAYIVKSQFEQNRLLDTIAKILGV